MTEKSELFLVIRNYEEQYSLWLSTIDVPAGWTTVFGPETKEACIAWVNEHWTDMRPLSLRRRMEGGAN